MKPIIASVLTAIVGTVSAQSVLPPDLQAAIDAGNPPAWVEVSLGSWTYAPVVANGVFVGLFASVDDAIVVGQNIDAVYVTTEAGAVKTYGWITGNKLKAVEHLRNVYGDRKLLSAAAVVKVAEADALGGNPMPVDGTDPLVDASPWLSLKKGAVEGSVAATLLDATNDPELAQILAAAGYPTAPELADKSVTPVGVPCAEYDVIAHSLFGAVVYQATELLVAALPSLQSQADNGFAEDLDGVFHECLPELIDDGGVSVCLPVT